MSRVVLVAGGAGYIGAHVCKALHAGGFKPVVLDNLSSGREDFVRWGPLVKGATDDRRLVEETLDKHAITAVIDLASSIEVAESVANPLKYYENNFARKIQFIRALQDGGVRAYVFSSTAAVYGEPEQVPISEDHPHRPANPYGASKLFFERLLADVHAASGFPWLALRYFNACGASPDGEIGEAHDPETHLVARACLAALGRVPPLKIFGTDYPTADGTAIRDYVHVADLGDAHVKALAAVLDGATPGAINLGSGQGSSIREVLGAFAQGGLIVPHEFAARRPGDPARLVANIKKAKTILAWQPRHDLDSIVASAHAWHAGQT